MRKLSEIIRKENSFYTIDNHVLKTIQDFLEFLMNCDEKTYSYHVNAQKNDFATWVKDVLLFPELSESLKISKNIVEARDAVMEFFQVFDYRMKSIQEEKEFHSVDDYWLKNLQELYYYVNNCDDNSYWYHVNDRKNDFANWVSDVLLFPALSAKMRIANDRNGILSALKEFLLTNTQYTSNPEYERYINEHLAHDDVKSPESSPESSKRPESLATSATVSSASSSVSSISSLGSASDSSMSSGSQSASQVSSVHSSSMSSVSSSSPSVSTPSKSVEETINLDKKFEYVREEDPEKSTELPIDKNRFRQFTDEELEKFVAFTKKENVADTDAKVEYLRGVLQELKNMIRDLRRAEKDAFVADLMMRTINAKIDFYALSKNVEDYNHIIRLMKDVQAEIEETSEHQSYNIAEELLKDLRLQGVAMKKA
jgi:hypothetical protein